MMQKNLRSAAFLFLAVLGFSSPAFAQGAVQQLGSVVNGDAVLWLADGLIADAHGVGMLSMPALTPGTYPCATVTVTTGNLVGFAAGSCGSGSGTVTSVALTAPSWLTVGGSPITGAGTLALTAASGQTANEFLATPNGSSGAVGLRAILNADLPVTAVTPGSYTSANITVNQQGLITAAANGSGGGITALTGPVTASGSGSVATTITPTGVSGTGCTSCNLSYNTAGQITVASNGSGGSVSVTASTPNTVIDPSPGTGTFTVGSTVAVDPIATSSYTIASTDAAKTLLMTNAGPNLLSLPAATGSGFGTGFGLDVISAAGETTITPATSTLCGQAGIFLSLNQYAGISSDGTNYDCALGMPPFGLQNLFLATPSGTSGQPSLRAIVLADLPGAGVTTVNGQSCALNGSCTVTALASGITVGTTTVGSGTTGYVLYDNGGTLGDLQPTGSGLAVLQTSPSLITPALGVATATSLNGLTVSTSTGTLTIANGKTLTDTSGVGADLLLGGTGGGFAAYGGANCTNQFLNALSAAGAGTCASVVNADLTAGTFSNITGVGALAAGSIASGFGTIATGNTISGTQLTSTVSTGTAPLVVSSTTNVPNLNASSLGGDVVGTSGGTLPLLNGTNTWSGAQTFGETLGTVTTQSGATYTFAATDCGTEVTFSDSSAITATIPATLPIGCNIAVAQIGTAKVSVNGSAVTPATLHSAHSYTGTSAQWAIVGINIEANSGGSSAIAILTGDGS